TGHGGAKAGISASRKLTWGTEIRLSTGFERKDYPSGTNDFTLYRGSINAEIRQPLLRGLGNLVNTDGIAFARSRIMEVRRMVEMLKADLTVETVRSYVALLRLKRKQASAGESAARMERLAKLTKAMERRGTTTHIDTLRSELQLGQALAQVESYGQEFESQMRDFCELLGLGTDQTFELEQIPFIEELLPEPGNAEDIALQNRLDYAQALHDLEDARRNGLVAKNRTLPDIALTLQYQQFGSGEKASYAADLGEHLWFAGLSSSTDLFRREDRIAYKQALANAEIAALDLEIIEANIRKQARQHLLAYRRGISELGIARRNFNLARSRAVLARKMFETGKSDNFSVTDAEMAYMNAENELLQSEATTTLAGYQLRRALGTLLEAPPDLLPRQATVKKEPKES
ncbi:MAG: TolC family protein, partial [bacterium]